VIDTDIDITSHALQDMVKTWLQLITWWHHQLLCSLPHAAKAHNPQEKVMVQPDYQWAGTAKFHYN